MAAVSRRLKTSAVFLARSLDHVRAGLAPVDPRWLIALSVLLLLVGGIVVERLARHTRAEMGSFADDVAQVVAVEERTRNLVTGVIGAETAVRAYVVSGAAADVQPFGRGIDVLTDEMQRLRDLTGSHPEQRTNLMQLETLANECFAELGRAIAVHDAGNPERAAALLLAGRVSRLIEAIRAGASLLVLEEQRTLAMQQQALASEAAVTRAARVFVVLVTAAFVVTILLVALQLRRLRRLARVCAWSRTIEFRGEWVSFEEYLRRRFQIQTTHGISPAEAAKMRAGV